MTNEHKDPSHVKAGWTPGPWRIDRNGVQHAGEFRVYAIDMIETEVAYTRPALGCSNANAALIASSPALAEALERIAGNPHSDLFDQTNPDHVRAMADRYDNVVGIAEAALALARGEVRRIEDGRR